LAYQLSRFIPATEPLIREVLREPDLIRQSFEHQFKKLLVEPMLAVRNTITRLARTKPAVMVIDALDKCDNRALMADFIEMVIGAFKEYPWFPFRFVFTSRVEEHIRHKLETPAARPVVHHLSLESFDARCDLHQFFQTRWSTIYEENCRVMRDVPLPWPSKRELETREKVRWSIHLCNYINEFLQ
jgi:hypothetical protein